MYALPLITDCVPRRGIRGEPLALYHIEQEAYSHRTAPLPAGYAHVSVQRMHGILGYTVDVSRQEQSRCGRRCLLLS